MKTADLIRAAAAAAWEEAYEQGYADRSVGAPPTRPNPYAKKDG